MTACCLYQDVEKKGMEYKEDIRLNFLRYLNVIKQ